MICCRVKGTSTIRRTPFSHTALKCLRAFHQILKRNTGVVSLPDYYTVLQASLNNNGSFSDIVRPDSMRYYSRSPPSERSQCVIDVYSEGERPDCISIASLLVPMVLGSDVERFVCVSRSSVCYLELNYPPCTSAAEIEQRQTVSRRDSWSTSLRSH